MTPFSDPPSSAETQDDAGLQIPTEGDFSDRRDAFRHAFPVYQRMAPYNGVAVPAESAFEPIRCHDLSTSGFSFYWPSEPEFDQLVLALHAPEGTRYLLAQVAFHRRQRDANGNMLIGCRFIRRLK